MRSEDVQPIIKLTDVNNVVLFKCARSAQFPDYKSVLSHALKSGVALNGLKIKGENLDNFVWEEVQLESWFIKDCSLNYNSFDHLTLSSVTLSNCNLIHASFTNVIVEKSHFDSCDFSNSRIHNTTWECFSIKCMFSSSHIKKSDLSYSTFHTCILSDAIFKHCTLDHSHFLYGFPKKEWLQETTFIHCSVIQCEFHIKQEIKTMHYWECDMRDIIFSRKFDFVKVVNTYTTILYCLSTDTLWWRPELQCQEVAPIFRATLKEFKKEIHNDFPNTDVLSSNYQVFIYHELSDVYIYLKHLKKKWWRDAVE